MKAAVEKRLRESAASTCNPQEANYAAGICAGSVKRDPALIMASEDFSFMLNQVPGCYINLGNGDGEGACEVHNPSYDFNDKALPCGVSFFARLVERCPAT